MISPQDTWSLWALILSGTALAIWLENSFKWAAKLSGPVIALLIAMVLSNLRIMPAESPAYDFIGDYFVPLAIPLLLFRANVFEIARVTGKVLIIFHVASLGTILGALLATWLLNGRVPGTNTESLSQVAGIMTASYIGGGINFFAVKETFGTSENLTGPLLVADNFIMAGAFVAMLGMCGSAWFRRHFPHPHELAAEQADAAAVGGHWTAKDLTLLDVAKALAVAFVIVALAKKLGVLINDALPPSFYRTLLGNRFVLITAIAVTAATLFPKQLASIRGADLLGGIFLYVFLFSIGLPADLVAVIKNLPMLFLFCLIMAVANMGLTLAVGRIFRWNLEEMVLCMNASLGGPPTAAAMAASKGWSKLVLPGLLAGIWGYIIGTAVGIATTNGLMSWLGAAK